MRMCAAASRGACRRVTMMYLQFNLLWRNWCFEPTGNTFVNQCGCLSPWTSRQPRLSLGQLFHVYISRVVLSPATIQICVLVVTRYLFGENCLVRACKKAQNQIYNSRYER